MDGMLFFVGSAWAFVTWMWLMTISQSIDKLTAAVKELKR